MILEDYTMLKDENGGYIGYKCVVIDDDGRKHEVVAVPRQHAGRSIIIKAAFAALKDSAVKERESLLDKAAAIMEQVRAEKATAPPPEEEMGTSLDVEDEEPLIPPELDGYTMPEGMPDMTWLKGEIQLYLFTNGIAYDEGMTKATLLERAALHFAG